MVVNGWRDCGGLKIWNSNERVVYQGGRGTRVLMVADQDVLAHMYVSRVVVKGMVSYRE